MKKTFRGFVGSALILSLLSATVLLPARPASAIAGLFMGQVGLVIAGAATSAAGGAGLLEAQYGHNSIGGGVGYFLFGGFGFFLGLILLDADGQTAAQFAPLSDVQGAKLGLTDDELRAYNGNLEEINAVKETVTSEMLTSGRNTVSFAHERWQAYHSELGEDTFSAVQKVSSAITEKMVASGVLRRTSSN